ncbi:flagellar basal body rod protein FlgC [Mesoterricola silvestris]|uniref:Flagellar basal-body rod protein FlgC n=1 Tax=Mesoterricola silvestris TaxID=2927979 RepID=A0AA48KAT0_9BACT|nr:flagellar basal body rod protein FlgC [Mesoterricola silvestris]BDU73627.1 flagellar basal-body rod protein FlgC [Mesoterricola silvestris]
MSTFDAINTIAASGLAAQRLRAQLVASNIANAETTRTPQGGPFRRKDAVFSVETLGMGPNGVPITGVKVAEIRASQDPFLTKFDPGHPDADASGIVQYPNVNPVEEMVNLTEASRGFDANASVVRAVRTMTLSAQDLLRVT